jgi:hypothetical protein
VRGFVTVRNFSRRSEFSVRNFPIKENFMHSFLGKGLVAMTMGLSLLAGGCASTDSVERATAAAEAANMRADQALSAANAAQQRADTANSAAQQAQSAADRAQTSAQNANSNAEAVRAERQQFEQQMQQQLARGERG